MVAPCHGSNYLIYGALSPVRRRIGNDWEIRIPEIKIFWGQYSLAEIGECKCIYAAITVSVEHELLM
jgi:hypothetical protein